VRATAEPGGGGAAGATAPPNSAKKNSKPPHPAGKGARQSPPRKRPTGPIVNTSPGPWDRGAAEGSHGGRFREPSPLPVARRGRRPPARPWLSAPRLPCRRAESRASTTPDRSDARRRKGTSRQPPRLRSANLTFFPQFYSILW